MERPLLLDRYRPLGEIGEGGFGSVVLAWDTRIQRRVAVKRMPLPRDSRGTSHLPPGLAEARTAAMLSHPNIVQVYDFDTDADEAFLIMEHVDGMNLGEILDSEERLSLDEAAAVVEAVADAVSFAHENGVLHLDIKPENILVDVRGRVKVADFGLADLSSIMGYSRALSGTIGYMPPEQIEGDPVDERTDEWAVASVALELLSGENLFAASSATKSLLRIEAPYITPASTLRSDLPGAADSVFDIALAAEPEGRYPSVTQLANELLPLLGDAREGRESLAIIVGELVGDEASEEDELFSTLGLWDRLDGTVPQIVRRSVSALGAGWITWMGVAPVFPGNRPEHWAAALLVAFTAAVAPKLGSLLGLIGLLFGLFALEAYLAAGILLVLSLAWWWLSGRTSDGESTLLLSVPLLALARIAPLQPLIAGFTLPWRRAAISALAGGVLAAFVSSATNGGAFVWSGLKLQHATATQFLPQRLAEMLIDPYTYAVIVAWVVSAIVMSMFCSRGSRALAALGSIVGSAVLFAGYSVAGRFVDIATQTWWPPAGVIVATSISLILMLIVSFLGAPLRSEDNDR